MADGQRVDRAHPAVAPGRDLDAGQLVELPRREASALHGDPALEPLGRLPVGERALRARSPLVLVDAQVGKRKERRGQLHDDLAHVVGPAAAQHLPGLLDLETVADRPTERRLHGRVEAA